MRYLLVGLILLGGLSFVAPTPAEARLVCHRNYYGELVCRNYRSPYYGGDYDQPRYYGPPPGYYGRQRGGCEWHYGRRICCPGGYTVQDGVCKPYRGF